jgi:hypothetical protein
MFPTEVNDPIDILRAGGVFPTLQNVIKKHILLKKHILFYKGVKIVC